MTSPQESGSDIEVSVTAVAYGGDGVGRVEGVVCFVPGALPGDVVRARVYRRVKNTMWARLLEVLVPAPCRDSGGECAGRACAAACAWRAFTYPEQGTWKRRIVEESVKRIGGLSASVALVETPSLRLGYRTRAIFHGDGAALGYYAPRTHDVISLPPCPLNHPRLNDALEQLRPLGIRGHVQVTVNPDTDETLVWLRKPMSAVRAVFPLTNTPADDDRAQFEFDGVPIVNGTFSQASLLLNRLLRAETDKRIGNADSLLDLYCGNGNLSLGQGAQTSVLGIDEDAAAVAAANQQGPGAYRRGDERAMVKAIARQPWDVILLDPPRTGAKALVPALTNAEAGRIVYVSCNPTTFARDAAGLAAGGWALTSLAALDMFPHTPHVESIGVFERDRKECM